MKKTVCLVSTILFLSFLAVAVALAEEDVAGSKDHPLFNRMPGFYISRYEDKEFDSHSFRDAKLTEIKVEGHLYNIVYSLKPGTKEPTRLQVLRNYENAVKKIGGTVLYSDWDGESFMKLVKEGKEIWVEISAYMPYQPTLWIIEKGAMVQDIVANADVFSSDIRATGHAAVYGIYFDTGKSVVKPDSEAALKEIAKLLKNDASLKVNVVGHTDNVGGIDSNMKLSQDRADAVVKTLISQYGIDPKRLKAYGVGPLAPVASNDTEEGKTKNRRVELVKQ